MTTITLNGKVYVLVQALGGKVGNSHCVCEGCAFIDDDESCDSEEASQCMPGYRMVFKEQISQE
jgi:hypothetical protein